MSAAALHDVVILRATLSVLCSDVLGTNISVLSTLVSLHMIAVTMPSLSLHAVMKVAVMRAAMVTIPSPSLSLQNATKVAVMRAAVVVATTPSSSLSLRAVMRAAVVAITPSLSSSLACYLDFLLKQNKRI